MTGAVLPAVVAARRRAVLLAAAACWAIVPAPAQAAPAAAATAAAGQDLTLALRHSSRSEAADGSTRTVEYRETFVRRGDTVWQARLLPASTAAAAAHPAGQAGGHQHLNAVTAARWVTRLPDGKLKLALADAGSRLVVDIDRSDYENVGFDGSWAGAWHLVDPAQLATMQPQGAARPDGARWYQGKRPGQSVRVLWDEALRYPRIVESQADDGSWSRRLVAQRVADQPVAPWAQLDRYERKLYADLLD